MSKNLRGLSERKGLKPGLFEEISGNAGIEGPDSQEFLDKIAERSLVGKSSVRAVSTFYDFLREGHASKKVFICDGTACLTSGKQKKLKDDLLGLFDEDEIGK
jgi:NADH-quinone oxidoreductase subunit F